MKRVARVDDFCAFVMELTVGEEDGYVPPVPEGAVSVVGPVDISRKDIVENLKSDF